MRSTVINDLQVQLHSLTFEVSGVYYPPTAGDSLNPPTSEEFCINWPRLKVLNQPDARPREILRAFNHPEAGEGTGQLEAAVLAIVGQENG